MTTCARCPQPAQNRFRARLRRVTGRGYVLSLPVALCPSCAATVAALLAPATLEREGGR